MKLRIAKEKERKNCKISKERKIVVLKKLKNLHTKVFREKVDFHKVLPCLEFPAECTR